VFSPSLLETPVRLETDQLESLEPVLDKIEPLKLGLLELIEEVLPLYEVLTEDIENPLEEAGRVEVLWRQR